MCSEYGFKKEILNYHNPKKKYLKSESDEIPKVGSFNFEEIPKKEKTISQETLCDNYFANHINIACYKYTENLYQAFIKAFSYLPIAAIINNTSICIHGGLSPHLEQIDNIQNNIQRPIENIDKNPLLTDLLWGDPSFCSDHSFSDNPRGLVGKSSQLFERKLFDEAHQSTSMC